MNNPERPIDKAFARIWQAFEIDEENAARNMASGGSDRWSYSSTRIAILAAVKTAGECDDSIATDWQYPPNSNEIVVRLREIRRPTRENITHAQSAVRKAMSWSERLEEIIRIGAGLS